MMNIRNNNSLINPLLGKCNNYLCRREKYLRIGTIFEPFSKKPSSVIYNIIDIWLNYELYFEKICIKLKELYNLDSINKSFVLNVLQRFRIYIVNYMKDLYSIESIAPKNAYNHIASYEYLFTHLDGVQQWVIGLINAETNQLRLEVVTGRDEIYFKKIITTHINIGNYIITDLWRGYNFLDDPRIGYIHNTYNHSIGSFGSGLDSTSRIESVWNKLKGMLKRIYNTIRSKNSIYFLQEVEFRRSLKGLNN